MEFGVTFLSCRCNRFVVVFLLLIALLQVSVVLASELPATNGAFVAISVRNMDEAIAWYSKLLGFKTVSRGGNEERKGALLTREGVTLELAQFEGAVARDDLRSGIESHEVHGIFKLGFTTPNLDATFDALTEAGVLVFFPIVNSSDGQRTFGVKDMDGNIVQFIGK